MAAPGDAVDEQVAAAVGAYVPQRHRGEGLLLALDDHDRSQSSSANRVTAGAFGFFAFNQSRERPELYHEPLRFDTIPSRPIRHACSNTSGPSASRCSLSCTPCPARASSRARVALRRSSGSRRRSSPFSSIKSKAYMKAVPPFRHRRISSKSAMPSSPHATASLSRMHEGKRRPRSLTVLRHRETISAWTPLYVSWCCL